MLSRVEKWINLLFEGVEGTCRLILLFMVCTVSAQVLSRALGGNIKWCEEVMLILLDMLMFLLLPVGIKADLHIRIEAFAKFFPFRIKKILIQFSNLIMLLVAVCMINYGAFLMGKTKAKFSITGFPRRYLYLITVVSGVLCLIVVLAKFLGLLKTKSTDDFLGILEET